MTDKKIKLKIGRKVYNIGTNDILMDNGASVRLTTQNGSFRDWTYTVPVLSNIERMIEMGYEVSD